MIAYTAWNSLQTIARQYDANLALTPGERLRLAPYRERSVVSGAVRLLAEQVRAGRVVAQAAPRRRS